MITIAGAGVLLYRGTSEDWPGHPSLQSLGVTPVSTDPLIAALFAIDCQRLGKGVFLACRQAEVSHLQCHANVLEDVENEVAIGVVPMVFVRRFARWKIEAHKVRAILRALGFDMPESIGDKRSLQVHLDDARRLDFSEIEEFNRRLIAEAKS